MKGKNAYFNHIVAVIMVFLLGTLISPSINAKAANDVTFTKDTTLTAFINRYNNVTVKSGVTVTMKKFSPDPQGLEISGNLLVEDGGLITGPGCIILEPTSSFSGIDFYYKVRGQEKLIPDGNFLTANSPAPDWRPTMLYSAATGHYVLEIDFDGDPYGARPANNNSAANVSAPTVAVTPEVEALKVYKGNTAEFNAYYYYMNYADLQSTIGTNADALLAHYNSFGIAEGRIANKMK